MSAALIVLLVVAVVLLAGSVALVSTRRRAGRLETPAASPGTPVEAPPIAPSEGEAPVPRPTESEEPYGEPAEKQNSIALPAEVAEISEAAVAGEAAEVVDPVAAVPEAPPRMRERLSKARSLLAGYVGGVGRREKIDGATWDDLEEALLRADVGLATTSAILDDLRGQAKAEKIKTPGDLTAALASRMRAVFDGRDRNLAEVATTTLWLFVGVNGVGKTTTIGKLAIREIGAGHQVVLAAGDTFRAAAGEQLEKWAHRSGADIVRGAEGGDPASVVFDAVQRAVARNADLVLADTAGRLHTKVNLMEELKKVRRVADRSPAEVTEVLLVIDATTGQNGLTQAKLFTEAVGVTGVVLTKLDGTAKGGIALAIEQELSIPIKLVGLGEGPADLVEFDPAEFVDAILP